LGSVFSVRFGFFCFGSVRFGFLGQKLVQTGLGSVFSGLARFDSLFSGFFGLGSVRFFGLGSVRFFRTKTSSNRFGLGFFRFEFGSILFFRFEFGSVQFF
jgi:hypothetical protein